MPFNSPHTKRVYGAFRSAVCTPQIILDAVPPEQPQHWQNTYLYGYMCLCVCVSVPPSANKHRPVTNSHPKQKNGQNKNLIEYEFGTHESQYMVDVYGLTLYARTQAQDKTYSLKWKMGDPYAMCVCVCMCARSNGIAAPERRWTAFNMKNGWHFSCNASCVYDIGNQ